MHRLVNSVPLRLQVVKFHSLSIYLHDIEEDFRTFTVFIIYFCVRTATLYIVKYSSLLELADRHYVSTEILLVDVKVTYCAAY